MRLQKKLILIIGSIWALLCLAIYGDAMFTLKHTYATQETKLIVRDIDRTQNAIQSQMQSLVVYGTAWADWNDAYQFMADKNKHFITANFVPASFINAKLNFIIFYDNNAKLYYGEGYDRINNKTVPLPSSLLNALSQNSGFLHHDNTASIKIGMLNLPEGSVIMSSLPVLTSNSNGPLRGTLLMGRYFTQADFNAINKTTSLKTQFISLPAPNDAMVQAILLKLKSAPYFIDTINTHTATAYFRIDAINQEPAYLGAIHITRSFYNEGLTTIAYYLVTLILAGLIILPTLWILLKKLIIDRILRVSQQVSYIIDQGRFDKKIEYSGHDEINDLITSINAMLMRIHETQGQLKTHLSKRTKELEQVSELNRNLFTEVGLHKNIEAKLLEEEKILKKMAYYDALTGLPSRAYFLDKFSKAISQCPRATKIALFLIDMNHFKQLNNSYGHAFGDLTLKILSERLLSALPPLATPGRLTADQWVVFVEKINNKSESDHVAGALFQHLGEPLNINEISFTPSFSIGISIYPDDSESVDELLKNANLAMVQAKNKKGNSHCYFTEVDAKKIPLTPL